MADTRLPHQIYPLYHQPDPLDIFLLILHLTLLSTETLEFVYLHMFWVLIVPSNMVLDFFLVLYLAILCLVFNYNFLILVFFSLYLGTSIAPQPPVPPTPKPVLTTSMLQTTPPVLQTTLQFFKQPLQNFKQPLQFSNQPLQCLKSSNTPTSLQYFIPFRPYGLRSLPHHPTLQCPLPPPLPPSTLGSVSILLFSQEQGLLPRQHRLDTATLPAAVKTIQSGGRGSFDIHHLISTS